MTNLNDIEKARAKRLYRFIRLYQISKIKHLFKNNYNDFYSAKSRFLKDRSVFKCGDFSPVEFHDKAYADIAKYNKCGIDHKVLSIIAGYYPKTSKRIKYKALIDYLIENNYITKSHGHGNGYSLNKNNKTRHPIESMYELNPETAKKIFENNLVDIVLDLNSGHYDKDEVKIFKKCLKLLKSDDDIEASHTIDPTNEPHERKTNDCH